MSPAVDFGRIIADCEHLDGFGPVMERVKAHEQGASSELVVGAMLVRLGYHPLFGAPLEGKVLDLRVDLGPTAVYFEVAAPHRSDVAQEAQQLASDLTRRLQSQNPACRVEIALLTDLTEEASKQIEQMVARVPSNATWYESPELAVARKTPKGTQLQPLFDGHSATVILGGETDTQGDSSSVTIRWPSSDHRLKRIFNDEHEHFSQDACNVLAINASAIPGAIADWIPLIERCFQPTQNRRVGAVALFSAGTIITDCSVRRLWKVITNPLARQPVPADLVEKIRIVDESKFWRGET